MPVRRQFSSGALEAALHEKRYGRAAPEDNDKYMRVLEKDVDMLSVSYIGKPPQPRKFKIRFRDGSYRTVKVDQIKRVDSVTPAGHPNFVYYCYSEVDDRIIDYELRYFVREMRWELYRVYE